MSSRPATLPAPAEPMTPAPGLSVLAGPAPDAGDMAAFYQTADSLCRCSMECCRQHGRLARFVKLGSPAAEQPSAKTPAAICDDALAELVSA